MGSLAQQLSLAQQFTQLGTWLRHHWPVRHPRMFINSRGVTREVVPGSDQRHYVRFPVHLAVSYGAVEYEPAGYGAVNDDAEEGSRIYNSFVLNASRGGLFIISERPFPQGSRLHIHFFIPPEEKLIGVFVGEVVGVNLSSRHPHGMHIKLLSYSADMKQMIAYLEERLPLLDHMV